jgi:hypothetical protein
MRRQFQLPEADVAHLESLGLPWEAVVEGRVQWLLVHGWPLPAGYNHRAVSIAIRVESGYPESQLDMVYALPHLVRQDGVGINNLTGQSIDGKDWQRWSRHRTEANPWRPGVDDLSTHLFLVDDWFAREFLKRAA